MWGVLLLELHHMRHEGFNVTRGAWFGSHNERISHPESWREQVEIRVGQLEFRVSDYLGATCHSRPRCPTLTQTETHMPNVGLQTRRVMMSFDHVSSLAGRGELFASFRLWHAEPHKVVIKKVRFAEAADGSASDR